MVWAHHGIVTWGDTAQESYEAMIELVTRAEEWAAARRAARGRGEAGCRPDPVAGRAVPVCDDVIAEAHAVSGRLAAEIIPVVRGLLAARTGDCDRPYDRVVIQVLDDPEHA